MAEIAKQDFIAVSPHAAAVGIRNIRGSMQYGK
jgi:hypothetical protein